MSLKLFLIRQKKNTGWNTYDSAVVAAHDAAVAATMYPGTPDGMLDEWDIETGAANDLWVADPKDVYVEYIGEAADDIIQSVICASFNAG
jgi:hypothetical protein